MVVTYRAVRLAVVRGEAFCMYDQAKMSSDGLGLACLYSCTYFELPSRPANFPNPLLGNGYMYQEVREVR